MPAYDYRCFDCGTTFEKLTNFAAADTGKFCTSCMSTNVKRLVPVIAAVRKGGGSMPEPTLASDFSRESGGSCCGGSCGCC